MTNTSYIFDLDDTLYLKTDPFARAQRKIFPEVDVAPEMLYAAFKKRGNESFEPSMRGDISIEEMYIYRISMALEDHGYSCTDEEALAFQREYNFCQNHLEPNPVMLEILKTCVENGHFTGIITNGLSDHQREKFYALGLDRLLPESHLLVSEDVGVNKPDPAILLHAEEKWELDPDNTVYIGDSMFHDIVCAKKAGWKAVLLLRGDSLDPEEREELKDEYEYALRNPDEYAPEEETDPAFQPDLVVSDYNELLEMLPQI